MDGQQLISSLLRVCQEMESLKEKKNSERLDFHHFGRQQTLFAEPKTMSEADFSWCSQIQYLTSAMASKALL